MCVCVVDTMGLYSNPILRGMGNLMAFFKFQYLAKIRISCQTIQYIERDIEIFSIDIEIFSISDETDCKISSRAQADPEGSEWQGEKLYMILGEIYQD